MITADNQEKKTPTVEALQKEVNALRRKLNLTEMNLSRMKLSATVQQRVEDIHGSSLKKELRFFKLVLENLTNILLLFDFDGRFAYASNTFLESADIASFGLIGGRHYQDVLEPILSSENLERFSDTVECAIREKRTVSIEEQLDFNFKGMPRTYYIYVTPMTEDGKSTGIMALFSDITEINNALETAKRANTAKSNFLANMSHEIRTPLNAIIGMSAIAQSSSDIEKIHYCIDKINDSSQHLLGVINDILDMSKIETNHFELSFSEFVFEKMLLRIVDVMRFKIEEKNIVFDMYCDPDIPYAIFSDEQRLAQVIMNLLSNAVKFTPENGSITIRADVESVSGNDYILRISVKDSGIGITEEQYPRLFKVFSQADGSISRKYGGTGLGLAISKNIVNMLEGDIWFESVAGKGTEFIFNIKTRSCRLNPVVKLDRSDVRILAVDDMPDVLLSFSMYSKKLGVNCATADSAEQALEMLKREHFDIVFVDWKMPVMDGLTFVKTLGDFSNRQMVVIMISAADWTDIENEAKSLGVREFISKPILLPVIESVLDKYCEDASNNTEDSYDDFTGKTVLLVDDIEINREIIISLIEPTGVQVECAENGREAVDMFLATPEAFDIVFMDVQMPEMDGYEATRQIRAFGTKAAECVPIVAMTANVFKEDIERCLASGMDDHIGKPVNVDEIFGKMRKWINGDGG